MRSFDERFKPADMDGFLAAITAIRRWLKGFHKLPGALLSDCGMVQGIVVKVFQTVQASELGSK